MAKSVNDQSVSSLKSTLLESKSMILDSPKTVQIDSNILFKLKNIVTDFPEYGLSSTKVLNAIIFKWLEDNRDELLQHHMLNASRRY
ncbi:hypothetical protein ACEN2P_19475 [Pedobacter psychrotolerans]|uniref:hypothetical protein n=1 Tax=Pedobacter psychrotolerans TaxID=1843235 RepID=UPI003F9A6C5F